MKYIFVFTLACFFSSVSNSQNVGIGNSNPSEKLDVNGSINVTGTIKVNGTDGIANQVLMKNSTGNLVWGDITEFKNMITFTTTGSSNWTIPAGVTRIWVEVWGGGGGGTDYGGGGGGAYVTGFFNVTPGGTLFCTVGAAGVAGASTATNGGLSSVTYSGSFINANGGNGNSYGTVGYAASGGSFSGSGVGYYGIPGEAGGTNKFESRTLNSTTYHEGQTGGKGGDAGNSPNSGGKPSFQFRDAVSMNILYTLYGSEGKMPGGGGGGNITWGGVIFNGGQGMIIVHY